jgi:hypothetical protein
VRIYVVVKRRSPVRQRLSLTYANCVLSLRPVLESNLDHAGRGAIERRAADDLVG